MKQIFLIPLLIFALAAIGYAQQDTARKIYNFSVADCINFAYEHQDSILNANLDVKTADLKVKQTIGQGLPQLSGTAEFQDYLKTPIVIFGGYKISIYQPYNLSGAVNLNQLIFDGSYFVGVKAIKTYKELSQRNLVRSRIDVNVNVTKAYYQVLVSNEQVKLLDANLKQIKEQKDQTVQQNKQGFVEKIDVDRITVQYNTLVNNRENTLRMLALNYQLLKFQMGMSIDADLELKDKLEDITLDKNLAEFTADTSFYHNRIEYELTETNLHLNEFDVKRQKAYEMPTVSFIGNAGMQYQAGSVQSLFNTTYPSSYIGLSLNVPIYSGGQKASAVHQSQINVQKSQNDLFNLKNALGLQASQARVTYLNGLQTLDVQKQNENLAEEVLRVARIKYQQGVGSSVEVTQAETDLQQADNTYIQGLYDALVSKVDLDKAYGRIQ